jgi:rhamnogalacturonyl hydrolase YesR
MSNPAKTPGTCNNLTGALSWSPVTDKQTAFFTSTGYFSMKTTLATAVFLSSVLLAGSVFAEDAHVAAPAAAESFAEVSADGAWCWFSEPRALGLNGKTYTGWVTKDGSIEAGELDGTNAPAKIFTLHKKLQRDDHNNPAFLALPDGRIAAFYATHSEDDLFLRVTEKPGDISAWTPIRRLGMLNRVQGTYKITYANPVRLESENNRIFSFFRGCSLKPTVSISDDLCQTWSKPQVFLSSPGAASNNRPYVRYWDDGKGRIDFLYTDGHPGLEPKNRVYFMRYEKGAFRKMDGTQIGTLATLPIDPEKGDVIYDGSAGRGWVWDICEDKSGNPVAVYTRMPGDTKETKGLDHRYHYAHWNGKAWLDTEIAQAGRWFPQTPKGEKETQPHYSPGISLDKNEPSIAYYSARVNDRLEIFRATTSDQGATFEKRQLTAGSAFDNVRPITVRNPNASSPAVMWMSNRSYRLYTAYDVGIRMLRPAPGSTGAPTGSADLAPAPAKDAPHTSPQTATPSADFTPAAVLAAAHAVADWQLAHPSKWPVTDWTVGTGAAGMMAASRLPGGQKYEDAMLALYAKKQWPIDATEYRGNDYCIGATYCELYFKHKNPEMIKPLQKWFDNIITVNANSPLEFVWSTRKSPERRWNWCDALFMAPPTWIRLYTATGDKKYLDFMNKEWWVATDYLYDKEEHLFFRDSTYFPKKRLEANGKKIFWGRGNGWVMGGLARVLQYFPKDHPDYPRYATLFKDMSTRIASLQQSDGLWRASLLDPASFPMQETSGSGFYCFALAWGINNGYLDRATYEPVVTKAWRALVGCVNADGKLTHVQPIAADPYKFPPESTEVYGVGAFLLAAKEVYELAQPAKNAAAKKMELATPAMKQEN